jgi:Tfp pilus assembly protein PilF
MGTAGVIGQVVASVLDLAATIAKMCGDTETSKRVDELLSERFPTFQRRAEEKMDEISRRLGGPTSP